MPVTSLIWLLYQGWVSYSDTSVMIWWTTDLMLNSVMKNPNRGKLAVNFNTLKHN